MLKISTKAIAAATLLFITMGTSCPIQIANQSESQIVIPMDVSSQRPVVEVMINGKGPYKFIFDTGSSTNVIDEKLADTLRLEVIGEDTLRTPGSDAGLMSKRVRVSKVSFSNTDISKEVIMNTVNLRQMLPVDGILSTGFFSEYLISIDYPNSKLTLTMGKLDVKDEDVISFIQNPRVINIDVIVGDQKVEAHLDSGNPGGFAIPYSLKDKLKFIKEPTSARDIRTPVASFKSWNATLNGNIKIGNVIYNNPEIKLVEGFKFVNLGYKLFKDLTITIDKKNNLIKFEKSKIKKGDRIKEDVPGESNDYTGWYGGHVRKIFLENNDMYLKRGRGSKLKLIKITDDNYKMVLNVLVNNELPNIRFERDENDKVKGLTFVFKDGREDFVKKDRRSD